MPVPLAVLTAIARLPQARALNRKSQGSLRKNMWLGRLEPNYAEVPLRVVGADGSDVAPSVTRPTGRRCLRRRRRLATRMRALTAEGLTRRCSTSLTPSARTRAPLQTVPLPAARS